MCPRLMSSGLWRGIIGAITHYKTSVEETHGPCIHDRGCIGGIPYVLDRFVRAAKPDRHGPSAQAMLPKTVAFNAAKEGKITEVGGYQFPKPGTDTPVPKVSFVTAVSDLGCGVGYFK